MERPKVADGEDGAQLLRVAANAFNKLLRTADRGCRPAWGCLLQLNIKTPSPADCDPCIMRHRTSWSSGQHSCFVFGTSGFKSRPGGRLSWLRVLWFFSVQPGNAGLIRKIRPRLLPSMSFLILYSLITLSFDTVKSESQKRRRQINYK
jgi:hypothetical protein